MKVAMSKEYLTNDLDWHYRIDYRQLCLNPECFIYHSVLYFKLFSSMQIQPFGFLSGMHQAYLYFVWLKGLACLTNCSRELTGQCQRRNQMVLQNFSYLKVKFFILKPPRRGPKRSKNTFGPKMFSKPFAKQAQSPIQIKWNQSYLIYILNMLISVQPLMLLLVVMMLPLTTWWRFFKKKL